jgi:hypothetical protein
VSIAGSEVYRYVKHRNLDFVDDTIEFDIIDFDSLERDDDPIVV